jgi:hypothetical protein
MQIVDSYSEEYFSNAYSLSSVSITKAGQSFTGDGGTLNSVKFFLSKHGSPTGNAVVKIYAHTGTFGVDGIPTGSALATSETIDVSTFDPSDYIEQTFIFNGINKITLVNGTKYFVLLEYSGGNQSDFISIASYLNSEHGGNAAFFWSPDWNAVSDQDCGFYVYKDDVVSSVLKDIIQPGIIPFPR